MIRAIVLKLLGFLEESLDPDLKAKVQAARKKAAELEAERVGLLKQIEDGERHNLGLLHQSLLITLERERLEGEITKSKQLRHQLEQEAEAAKAVIDARSDDDAIFGGVPKPRV